MQQFYFVDAPSSLGRYSTLLEIQCNLSQKKSTKHDWISDATPIGGSIQLKRCQRVEATKLFITESHPLYDIFGSKKFHLSSRPFTFSMTPSTFFIILFSLPEKIPKYLSLFRFSKLVMWVHLAINSQQFELHFFASLPLLKKYS